MTDFETVTIDGVEKLVTPVDHTGLPYCFAPTVKLPPVGVQPVSLGELVPTRVADDNHQFPKWEVLTSTSPALVDSELGRAALVGSRVQWVAYQQHHGPYNNKFVGPRHPQTNSNLWQALVMAVSGYIPEHGLDLSGSEPRIVGLTKKQRKWLWTSQEVRVYCQSDVGKFLLDYVLQADMDHLKQVEVEEFLYTFDYEKRLKLGEKLVGEVVERAAEPVEPTYREVRRSDLLTYVTVGRTKKPSPPTAQELVRVKLVRSQNQGYVHSVFLHRFAKLPRRSRSEYESLAA